MNKNKNQPQGKQDSRAQQRNTTRQHGTTAHSTGEHDTTANHAKKPNNRAASHAARQGHQRQHTPPEDNTRQTDPPKNTPKQPTTPGTNQRQRGRGARHRAIQRRHTGTANHSSAQDAQKKHDTRHKAPQTARQSNTAPNSSAPGHNGQQGSERQKHRNKTSNSPRPDTAEHGQNQTRPTQHRTRHSTAPDSSPRNTGPAQHSATENAQRSGPAPQQNTAHRAPHKAKRNSTGHRTQPKETAQQTPTQQQPTEQVTNRASSKVATKLQSGTLGGSGTTTKFTKLQCNFDASQRIPTGMQLWVKCNFGCNFEIACSGARHTFFLEFEGPKPVPLHLEEKFRRGAAYAGHGAV